MCASECVSECVSNKGERRGQNNARRRRLEIKKAFEFDETVWKRVEKEVMEENRSA